MEKLLLVDGSALLHRAYHAYPSLTVRGEAVGAVYGVTRMLIAVLREQAGAQAAVAWDLPGPSFRHKKYVAYKAQRPEMRAELVAQIPRVKEVVAAMGIKQVELEGYEADDLIGSLACQAAKQEMEVIIVTGDQDLMQLVSERVRVLILAKGKERAKLYGPKEVEEKYGVRVEQIVDYKALVGDASDNIPGVSGIGPKTAGQLLRQWGSLARLYKNLAKLEPKLRAKLAAGKESAWLSRELARIETGLELGLDLAQWRYQGLERPQLRQTLAQLGFKSLERLIWGQAEEKARPKQKQQMELFG